MSIWRAAGNFVQMVNFVRYGPLQNLSENGFLQNFVDLDHSFDMKIDKNIKKFQLASKLTNLHKEI
jgi:hypothetical protein